jgi:L-ascorbate metabolism protein UlaG (beta-lactamase superfamily)
MTAIASGPAGTTASVAVPSDASRELAATALALDVRFLGHSTVTLDAGDIRILTDPFLRERLGPLRRHGPTPVPASIGRVDVVVVSHAHPDHFDRASLKAILGDPLVIVPRGLGGAVRRTGLRARELVVGEQVAIAPRWTITAVPARHWRWPAAPAAATLGYLIEGPGRVGIYFAGDTARFGGLRDLTGRVDLALLPIGSWGPHTGPGHLSPRSAAQVARDVGARVAVPIHWGTLYPRGLRRLLGDRLTRPAARFAAWSRILAPELTVHALEPGEATALRL